MIFFVQSPDELRVVHLAVHPSAWSSTPPDIPKVPHAQSLPSRPAPQSSPEVHLPPVTDMPPPIPQATHPLAFVLLKHQNALHALTHEPIGYTLDISDLGASRSLAIQAVELHGWTWPAILDEEFPAATEGGLQYDRIDVEFVTIYLMCPHHILTLYILVVKASCRSSIPRSTRQTYRHMPSKS